MSDEVVELIGESHLMFECPGCGDAHSVKVNGSKNECGAGWQWNGSMTRPTFSPSILVRYGDHSGAKRCHSFIKDGVWEFLNDCTHKLAGKKVPMLPVEE